MLRNMHNYFYEGQASEGVWDNQIVERPLSANSAWRRVVATIGLAGILVLIAGCKGTQLKGEKEARQQVQSVSGTYRPDGQKPPLPVLTTNSSLADFLTYALL